MQFSVPDPAPGAVVSTSAFGIPAARRVVDTGTEAQKPASGNTDGQRFSATDTDRTYVWNGSAWEPEGSPRPTSAAPVRAASPQGQGFGNYGDLRGFVSQQIPGARFTSGFRSQAEQDDLVRRGKTRATRSQHTYGMGQDFVPPVPMSQWPEIARQLEATGRFRTVLIETGKGRNQGTAPHIHLEPR